MLYPLKFKTITKERVWGSEKWLLSGLEGDLSLVSNGTLKGNNINELIEIFLGELVGERVYEQYGEEFPLLIKILNIQDPLSLQIHPNDQIAAERHNAYGKHECWYIKKSNKGAKIYLGLKEELTMQELYERCEDGSIESSLNHFTPISGQIVDIAPGTLHSAKGGIELIEVQQNSDITYRVYDWKREGELERQIDIDLAIDCIDYKAHPLQIEKYTRESCTTQHFTVKVFKPENGNDSFDSYDGGFTLYLSIEGGHSIEWSGESVAFSADELILIPASLGSYAIKGEGKVMAIQGI